jgi:Xaa-Pro dipeptidase
LHGAVIPANGDIVYLSPAFEEPKTRELIHFGSAARRSTRTRRHW